ncbi:MAG: dihydropteroate synthase [Methanoregula sp.]|jgi:dihydropteroate synthase|nr:dihydropteroate synthase [Methanoregula sp.]
MRDCVVNKLRIGGDSPVRLMGVINCSPESFYANSYIPTDFVHKTAVEMVEQGADLIDIGARSTAPNTQAISGSTEAERIDAALRELDGSGITVSVDTMNPWVLDTCFKHEIHAINDISGLSSPVYAERLARSGLPAFLMASNDQPGDAIGLEATLTALARVVQRCENTGVKDYVLDPGIGIWTPFRSVEDDWTLCQNFSEFGKYNRPVLAAISRKTFIGDLLNRAPEDRLAGSLAVTLMLLSKGASVVRTHDVAQTRDVIRVFERMVKQ